MDISPNPSIRVLRKRKKIEESMKMEVEEPHANIEGESKVPVRGTTKVAKRKSTTTRYVHGLYIDISWCRKVNFRQLLDCSTLVKGTQIDFNAELLGKLLGVPVRGTDVYFKK